MESSVHLLDESHLPPAFRTVTPRCRRLYVCGSLPPEHVPKVAVVGSRTPSPSGRHTAYEMGRGLARAGVVVVSGLARGIDAAAHQGALDAGGITVAVLGSGVDVVYPRSSRELAAAIPERGALVSEYPRGTPPLPYQFVHRNRLVAAYTLGTLVVEGGARSGALITAGYAVEMSRELWAVPGDPRRPSCQGNNRLLRDGAGVVLDAADVLAAVGLAVHRLDPGEMDPPADLSDAETAVWKSLTRRGPGDPEALSRRTGLTAAALLEALSLMELAGHIERDGEGYVLVERGGRSHG